MAALTSKDDDDLLAIKSTHVIM